MALKFRAKVLMAKIESSYGVDAGPAEAQAIQMMDVTIDPLAGGTVKHDYLRPDLGGRPQVHVNTHVAISGSVSLAGAGTAGTAPAYGPLLRGCGMSETIAGSPSIAANVPQGAAVGRFTASTASAFTGVVPRTVTLTCTTPGGSGVAAFTVAAPQAGPHAAYSQAGVVMTDSAAFALPNGASITPTVTTPFNAGDAFIILLSPARVLYRPVGTGEESLSLYFILDGNRHKALGARGSVSWELAAGGMPVMKFAFLGLYVGPDTVTPTAPVFSGFRTPVPLSDTNTPDFKLHGLDGVMRSLTMDLGVEVRYRDYVNGKQVLITDRDGKGSLSMEAVPNATKDYFAATLDGTLGPLHLTHGLAAGNIVQLDTAQAQLLSPKYDDDQGIAMLSAELLLIPSDAGNDELIVGVM